MIDELISRKAALETCHDDWLGEQVADAIRALPAADAGALGALPECGHPFCGMKCGDGGHEPPDHAALLAAALALPELAALVDAANQARLAIAGLVSVASAERKLDEALHGLTALEARHDPA